MQQTSFCRQTLLHRLFQIPRLISVPLQMLSRISITGASDKGSNVTNKSAYFLEGRAKARNRVLRGPEVDVLRTTRVGLDVKGCAVHVVRALEGIVVAFS